MTTYEYREESGHQETADYDSLADALGWAKGLCREGDYGDLDSTIWVHAWIMELDQEGDDVEEHRITVAIDPEEPDCGGGGAHDWQSPHEIVGGIEENPGVWGHGGGVVITEVCVHCGVARVTDTWAQNPTTGEQGLEGVSYHDQHVEAVEQMIQGAIVAAIDGAGFDGESIWHSGRVLHITVPDEGDPAGAISDGLPDGWAAGYTGDSNTEADGTTTTDIAIERR